MIIEYEVFVGIMGIISLILLISAILMFRGVGKAQISLIIMPCILSIAIIIGFVFGTSDITSLYSSDGFAGPLASSNCKVYSATKLNENTPVYRKDDSAYIDMNTGEHYYIITVPKIEGLEETFYKAVKAEATIPFRFLYKQVYIHWHTTINNVKIEYIKPPLTVKDVTS